MCSSGPTLTHTHTVHQLHRYSQSHTKCMQYVDIHWWIEGSATSVRTLYHATLHSIQKISSTQSYTHTHTETHTLTPHTHSKCTRFIKLNWENICLWCVIRVIIPFSFFPRLCFLLFQVLLPSGSSNTEKKNYISFHRPSSYTFRTFDIFDCFLSGELQMKRPV